MPESSDRPLPWLLLVSGEPPIPASHVQGRSCRTRAGLFTEWAERLRFPEYFGHNWDALSDCLKDLVDEGPLTLVVDDAAWLLADESPTQLATLLTVLRDVDDVRPGRLKIVLRCAPAEEQSLRRRIAAAV